MRKINNIKYHTIGFTECYEGTSIEKRVEKMIDSNEPIDDQAELCYTEEKDGILPQYDIRTDKWDLALDAMDKANMKTIQDSLQGMNDIPNKTTENTTAEHV